MEVASSGPEMLRQHLPLLAGLRFLASDSPEESQFPWMGTGEPAWSHLYGLWGMELVRRRVELILTILNLVLTPAFPRSVSLDELLNSCMPQFLQKQFSLYLS